MADDYKDEIRSRMEEGRPDYVYRGGDEETIRGELEDSTLPGEEYPVYTFPDPQQSRPFDSTIPETATVAGGVTDDLAATRRFRGVRGVALVLDATANRFPYVPISYSYDFYNGNPGVLPHVLSTADGEVRDAEGDLYGVFEDRPLAGGGRSLSMAHTRDDGLPATSSNSRFADEREWVASGLSRAGVSTRSIVDGMVGVLASDRADIEEYHDRLFETMPLLGDIYTIRVDGEREMSVWDESVITEAIGPRGRIDPSDVPPRFRNGWWA
jgi:hypothetical protein